MFHVYKNGICISGIFGALYTDDPETAYLWMRNRMKNNQYFNYRLHPDWAKYYTLERHDKRYRVYMGAPIEQAIIDTDEADDEEDEFYDPLDHPDRERHIPCCDHPNDHFGE